MTMNLSKGIKRKGNSADNSTPDVVKKSKTEHTNLRDIAPNVSNVKAKHMSKKIKKKDGKTNIENRQEENTVGKGGQTRANTKAESQTGVVKSSSLSKKKKKKKTDHDVSKSMQHSKGTSDVKIDNPSKSGDSSGSKTKKELTFRQKHKRKKLAEKRKASRQMKKTLKGKVTPQTTAVGTAVKQTVITKEEKLKEKPEKITLPKTVVEATSNWRKLKMTLKQESEENKMRRKTEPTHLRNPKYRKIDEKNFNEKVISEVMKKDKKTPEIWFDDVDDLEIDNRQTKGDDSKNTKDNSVESDVTAANEDRQLVKPEAYKGVTSIVGMDCEMVGVRSGHESILARVSIVNRYGEPIYDKFVQPTEKVTDYRTGVSGVRPEDLKNGEPFQKVRREVKDILKGRILVGHALRNDFRVLKLYHPVQDTRDTSTYPPFRKLCSTRTPGLRKLTEKVMSIKIQRGEHSSIQDAQAAIRLYTLHRTEWESQQKTMRKKRKKKKGLQSLMNEEPSDTLETVDRLWDVE